MLDLIEQALEGLRPSLAEDGFELKVISVEGNDVTVALEAGENACLDCLVPGEVMQKIVDAVIRGKVPNIGRIQLEMRIPS